MARKPHVLAINGGSSSIKFAVYAMSDPPERRLHGSVDRIGTPEAKFLADDGSASRPESRDLGNVGRRYVGAAVAAQHTALAQLPHHLLGEERITGGPLGDHRG